MLRSFARDALVVAVAATGLPILRLVRLKRRGPVVRVLTVHDVEDGNAAAFDRMVGFLRRRFNVISPAAFEQRDLDPRRVNVLVTFDDGYASWRSNALPVLARQGVRPIFFLSSGFIDTAGDPAREAAFCAENLRVRHRRPLSWEDAALLAEHGDVGGHTAHHRSLAGLRHAELEQEVARDKHVLERRLGEPLRYFAYPFGLAVDVDQQARSAVEAAGYRYGFGATPGFVDGSSEDLLLPRLNVDPDRSLPLLWLSIVGAYDPVFRLGRLARR